MRRDRFVTVAIVAIGLIVVGFIVRGLTRVPFGAETADLLAFPFIGGGFVVIVGLTILAALAKAGIGPLAPA